MDASHLLIVNSVVALVAAVSAWVRTFFVQRDANNLTTALEVHKKDLAASLENHKNELAKELKAFETRQSTRARGIEWGFAGMREAHGGLLATKRLMTKLSGAIVISHERPSPVADAAIPAAIRSFEDALLALRARATTLPPELYAPFDAAVDALDAALTGITTVGVELKRQAGGDVRRVGEFTRPVNEKVAVFMAAGRKWWTTHMSDAPPPPSLLALPTVADPPPEKDALPEK